MLFVNYPSWLKPEIIPGLPIRWYGLSYLLGFSTAYLFLVILIKREGKDLSIVQKLPNLFFWSVLSILIGGRVFSEVIYNKNPALFLQPWLFFWPFDADMNFVGIRGMSYHGALIGGFVGATLYCKKHRIPIREFGDKALMGTSLGYFFGRMGNFANAELYGRVTRHPMGMIFSNARKLPYGDERVKEIADAVQIEPDVFGLVNLPRHPSQLYEAFFESLVVFCALFFIYLLIRNTKRYLPGMFMSLYLVGYGLARFFVEYFRQPDPQLGFVLQFSETPNPIWLFVSPFNFSMGQILSALMVVVGLLFLWVLYVFKRRQSGVWIKKGAG